MDCRLNQLLVFVNRIGRHDKSTIVLLLLFHISSFNLFLKIYLIIVSSRFLPFFFLKIYANLLFFLLYLEVLVLLRQRVYAIHSFCW